MESLLQENEGYNAVCQQQALLESGGSASPPEQSPQGCNSFWEQKRRMSINDNQSSNGNGSNSSGSYLRTNKLNDQNLKELVQNGDNGYLSSSSAESVTRGKGIMRRTSSTNSLQSNKFEATRRRSSAYENGSSINIGPFGPINETASRRTFAYLIAILNASYPDHDFSLLEPTDFLKVSLKSMISKFENALYSLGKKPEEWMWEVINSHMDMSDCVIYQYNPARSFMDDEPGHLWSLIWFLFNKKRKRVAYLYLTSARLNFSRNDINEDDEKESNTQNSRKRIIIGEDSNQFEGEYDLTYEENAIEDDVDDAIESSNKVSKGPF